VGRLTGFYDAAGHPQGENTLIVCGHVSETRKWARFEVQWRKALADVGVSGPFHMTDFMSCAKAFKGWQSRENDRVQLLSTLISIVKRNVYKAFSETILLNDWRAVNEVYQLEDSHCTPFALAAFYVMDRTICWWGKKHPKDVMTEFVFEDGDKNKGDFIWMMERIVRRDRTALGVATPVFKPKGLAPLEAADLTGWTMRRATKVWLTKEPERSLPNRIREVLLTLSTVPHLAGYLNREHIAKFCQDHNVPKRGETGRWSGVVRRS
jgi:hypothetical protein